MKYATLWDPHLGTVSPKTQGVLNSSIRPGDERFMLWHAERIRPILTIVEAGTHFGYSAWWMARCLLQEDGEVHTFDPDEIQGRLGVHGNPVSKVAIPLLRERLPIEFHIGDFFVTFPKWHASEDPVIDLAFYDGDHSYEATLKGIKILEPALRPGGQLYVHDIKFPGLTHIKRACIDSGLDWHFFEETETGMALWEKP